MTKPEEQAEVFIKTTDWTEPERAELYSLVNRMAADGFITLTEFETIQMLKADADTITSDLGMVVIMAIAAIERPSQGYDREKYLYWMQETRKVNPMLKEFIIRVAVDNNMPLYAEEPVTDWDWVQDFNC